MYIIYSMLLSFLICDSVPFILAQAVSQISSSLSPDSTASVLDLTESTIALSIAEITTQTDAASSSFVSAIPTELSDPLNITGTPDPGLSSSDMSQVLPSESNPRATSTTIEWITASLPPSTTTTTITFPLSGSETTLSETGTSASASTPSFINTATSEVSLSTSRSTSLVSTSILISTSTSVFSVDLSTSGTSASTSTPSSTNAVTSEVFLNTSQFTSLVSASISITTSTSVPSIALSTPNSTLLIPPETEISVIPTGLLFSSVEPSSIAPSASSGTVSSGIEPLPSSTAIITTDSNVTTLFILQNSTANSSTIPLPESGTFSTVVATLPTVPIDPLTTNSSVVPSVLPTDLSSSLPITTVFPPSPSGNNGNGSSPSASGSNSPSQNTSGSESGSFPSDSIASVTPQSSAIKSNLTISYQSETPTAATDTVSSPKPSDVPSIIETTAPLTVISLDTNPSGIEPTSSAKFSVLSSAIISSEILSEFDTSTADFSTNQVNTTPHSGLSHISYTSTIETINPTLSIATTTTTTYTFPDVESSSSPLDETFSSDIKSLFSTTSVSNSGFLIESTPTMTTLLVSTSPISASLGLESPPSVESSTQSLSVSSVPITVSFLPGDMAESKTTTYLSSVYTLIQVYTRSPTSSVVELRSSPILPN
ncbi:hypothetical protein EAE96_005017 [Botrytis aclada]|nr:hypothetical protein EAE96_005017 [Botrytis aclada]